MGNIKGDTIESYQGYGPGILLSGVFDSTFTKIKAVGMVGTEEQNPNAPADASGLTLSGCSSIDVSGVEANYNTGHGIVVVNSQFCKIRGGSASHNTKNGYIETGTANGNLIADIDSLSNGVSSIVQIGANSVLRDDLPNSGTRAARLVGFVTL
jgi:parallel beta-helix repeat protein